MERQDAGLTQLPIELSRFEVTFSKRSQSAFSQCLQKARLFDMLCGEVSLSRKLACAS